MLLRDFVCDRVCKPGSVIDSHLGASLPVRSSHLLGDGRASLVSSAVLLRIEFTAVGTLEPPGALLPHLSTLAAKRRYISVALFLKLPSAGVTRYPCPMEPGLSSCTGFHLVPAVV